MKIEELLKKGEEAFHNMDWRDVVRINEEILNHATDERIRNLATGFYHYAQIILNLDNAGSVHAHWRCQPPSAGNRGA